MMNYTYKRGLHSDTGLEVDHAGVVEPEHKLGLPHVVPDGQKWIFEGSFQACKIIYKTGFQYIPKGKVILQEGKSNCMIMRGVMTLT